jgi:hypothetical protein
VFTRGGPNIAAESLWRKACLCENSHGMPKFSHMRILTTICFVFVVLFIGCQSVTEYSVPAGLDVFESGQMPAKPMKLIGEIKDDGPLIEKSDIEAAMMKRAKKRGADFIILHST